MHFVIKKSFRAKDSKCYVIENRALVNARSKHSKIPVAHRTKSVKRSLVLHVYSRKVRKCKQESPRDVNDYFFLYMQIYLTKEFTNSHCK